MRGIEHMCVHVIIKRLPMMLERYKNEKVKARAGRKKPTS